MVAGKAPAIKFVPKDSTTANLPLLDVLKQVELNQSGKSIFDLAKDTYGWELPTDFKIDLGQRYSMEPLELSMPLQYGLESLRDPSTNEFTFPTPVGDRTLGQAEMLTAVRDAVTELAEGSIILAVEFGQGNHKARVQYQDAEGTVASVDVNSFLLAKGLERQLRTADLTSVPVPTSTLQLQSTRTMKEYADGVDSLWLYRFQAPGGVRVLTPQQVAEALNVHIGAPEGARADVVGVTLQPDGNAMFTYVVQPHGGAEAAFGVKTLPIAELYDAVRIYLGLGALGEG